MGYLHEGLSATERKIVEQLFNSGEDDAQRCGAAETSYVTLLSHDDQVSHLVAGLSGAAEKHVYL